MKIKIQPNTEAEIIVNQFGNKTQEIGFVIKNASGEIIYSREAGVPFPANTIFYNFCLFNCSTRSVEYSANMSGSGSQGTVYIFKQNGDIVGTAGLPSGANSSHVEITLKKNQTVYVILTVAGNSRFSSFIQVFNHDLPQEVVF